MIPESTRLLGDDLVKNHTNWQHGRYTLNNTVTNRALWICNGITFLDYSPNANAFGWIERIWLWRRVKKCLALNAITPLTKGNV